MTGSDAVETSNGDGDGAPERPRISRYRVLVALMFGFIAAFVLFVFWRGVLPASWHFSIEAETEIVEIKLRPDTQTLWQVDGAVLCVRDAIKLDSSFKLDGDDSPCRGRGWTAWHITDPTIDFELEQVIELEGDTAAMIELREDGRVAVSLRAGKDDKEQDRKLGTFSVVGLVEDMSLGNAANLVWTKPPARSVKFPFSGSTTLGRTVSWSSVGVLRSGNVAIYTADESADKRRRVDETALVLGDQVHLAAPTDKKIPWPKGFARIQPGADVIQVVAFGEAIGLRIERYGESGYELKPDNLRKLLADPMVALLGSLLAAYMTFILALQPFVDDGKQAGPATDMLEQFKRWIRRQNTP